MEPEFRDARMHTKEAKQEDQRRASERDRDRILYTSAFRRLAGVTQVVSPEEGHIFHNRLTHTLEVAQIARRLAEKLVREDSKLAQNLGGLDPDVVEAAAMAHDLGHPPFGHIAEQELDRLAKAHGDPDGFEGNAQSFRIVARTAAQRVDYSGLNLTRATLNAVLKYPWLRKIDEPESDKYKKFGAYRAEEHVLRFARERYESSDRRSLEAAVMDYADDVAYSVHDLDDFFRAGLIPIDQLANNRSERQAFFDRWSKIKNISDNEMRRHKGTLGRLLGMIDIEGSYTGLLEQRSLLRTITSNLIKDFIFAVSLQDDPSNPLFIDDEKKAELKCLKGLVWTYVISNPKLATQQYGQRQIIEKLFQTYLKAIHDRYEDLIPRRFQRNLQELGSRISPSDPPYPEEIRLAVDIVASFTDSQAVGMYKRLMGVSPGSVVEILLG